MIYVCTTSESSSPFSSQFECPAIDDFYKFSSDYESLANEAMHVTENLRCDQNVLIIQPYIKWGPEKSATTPDLKLQEAECLIRSLDTWRIRESVTVGLESFDKPSLFGIGKLKELTRMAKKYNNDLDKKVKSSKSTVFFFLPFSCAVTVSFRFHAFS